MSSSEGPDDRLLIHVVDDVANQDPQRPFVFLPRSSDPTDGWKTVSYLQAANGINYLAHQLVQKHGTPSPETFPTIAYLGPSDLRYILFLLGAVKAGYKALFVSPRNPTEVQLHLFKETECVTLWRPASFASFVQPWLEQRDIAIFTIPDLDTMLSTTVSHFPYPLTFAQADLHPMVVLHTSGSTGMPKPIVSRQGLWTIGDEFRRWPVFHGTHVGCNVWAERASKIFMAFPFFHAAGLQFFMHMTILMGTPCALPIPDRPMSGELVRESLQSCGADAALLPSSILEELSASEEGIATLSKLQWISFGGGNLPTEAGNRLANRGITLSNAIGSTEYGIYPVYFNHDPTQWQYFLFNLAYMGCEFRPFDGAEEDVYELFAVRPHGGRPTHNTAGVFYTFPELTEWSTRDLYRPHPFLPDHWAHVGRVDNVIVFSNGEKLNPATMEDILAGHSQLKAALVVGQKRFQAAVILEPASAPSSPNDREGLIEDVWPLIQKANEQTVAHGRIARDLVMIAKSEKPFLRAGKGTIQRASTAKLYETEIDALYERAAGSTLRLPGYSAAVLDVSSKEPLTRAIIDLFSQLGSPLLEAESDFFASGSIDSLQVVNATRALRAGLAATGIRANVSTGTIYAHSTPQRLASYLLSAARGDITADQDSEIQCLRSLLAQYTQNLPARADGKPPPAFDSQVVILTGSTGSLGSYLLDALIANPRVGKIFALNRYSDGGLEKQSRVSAQRGLSTSWEKVNFLSADLAQPRLGLSLRVYETLCLETDRIIHNAWPVNFHYSAASFAPHVAGIRYLVDLAAAAQKRVPIVFVSSRGTVDGWRSASGKDQPVPEERLPDLTLALHGYGRAKAASSLLLDAAQERSGVPCATLRLGQIAGPRGPTGQWNPAEFLPSLIRSSLYLGMLPFDLGSMNLVDWIPVEDAAGIVLDVAGVAQPATAEEISGYFHGVNPRTTSWTALSQAVMKFYGGRLRDYVSLGEWIAALERSAELDAKLGLDAEDMDARCEANPAVKLLDTYKAFLEASREGRRPVVLSTERTAALSQTMRKLEAVTPELMTHWCRQWDF